MRKSETQFCFLTSTRHVAPSLLPPNCPDVDVRVREGWPTQLYVCLCVFLRWYLKSPPAFFYSGTSSILKFFCFFSGLWGVGLVWLSTSWGRGGNFISLLAALLLDLCCCALTKRGNFDFWWLFTISFIFFISNLGDSDHIRTSPMSYEEDHQYHSTTLDVGLPIAFETSGSPANCVCAL